MSNLAAVAYAWIWKGVRGVPPSSDASLYLRYFSQSAKVPSSTRRVHLTPSKFMHVPVEGQAESCEVILKQTSFSSGREPYCG